MLVRFGFVAMSVTLENASPSKTVTYKSYRALAESDPEAALEKVKRVARENLANTLRIIRHCDALGDKVYRFSSKIIPLATHPDLAHWDYITDLAPHLRDIGDFVKEKGMRATFHPDHYTLINSPREEVFLASVRDLAHHCRVLIAMGLDEQAKLITHVGGGYQDKEEALEKFIENWGRVPKDIAKRMTLENDDKTFTAIQTLYLCEKLQLPLVLDLHHFRCNHEEGSSLTDIYARFIATWQGTGLPPKLHVSSARSESDVRSHHDFVDTDSVYPHLMELRGFNRDLDIMVEAKQKDRAMILLVQELGKLPGIRKLNDASIVVE